MLAGVGKSGDYAGDPLLTVAKNSIFWLDQNQQMMQANWTAASGVDSNAHWVLYNHGAIVSRITAQTYDFTVAQPGTIPNLAAVAVPAACYDGLYDPLNSNPLLFNLKNIISPQIVSPGINLDSGNEIICENELGIEFDAAYELEAF